MLTPLKAIRAKCLECSAGSVNDVKACQITACPLFPYWLGKNPSQAGIGNHSAVLPNSASDFAGNSPSESNYTPATKNAAERPSSPAENT